MTTATGGGGHAGPAVVLREMRWWDIGPVLELERELFPDDAWSEGMFWSELAHARGPLAGRAYLVAEAPGGRIVGYGGLAASGGGGAGGTGAGATGDIQTVATARDQWGTGLGARLLGELLARATAFECEEVLLEVRVDNHRAQRLYERFGFEPVGLRRGYYQPGNVDALVMRRPRQSAEEAPGGTSGGTFAPRTAPHPDAPARPRAGHPGRDEQGTTIHG